jgi:hypothetical protein
LGSDFEEITDAWAVISEKSPTLGSDFGEITDTWALISEKSPTLGIALVGLISSISR